MCLTVGAFIRGGILWGYSGVFAVIPCVDCTVWTEGNTQQYVWRWGVFELTCSNVYDSISLVSSNEGGRIFKLGNSPC